MKTSSLSGDSPLTRKTIQYIFFAGVTAAVAIGPLRELLRIALSEDTYSHILVVPLIALGLLYMEKDQIFRDLGDGARLATGFAFLGALAWLLSRMSSSFASPEVSLALKIISFLAFLWCGFAWVYGGRTAGAAIFPLLFLLLMLPPPEFLLDRCITWLQWGSADVTEWLFYLTRTPFTREGLIFRLPGLSIEIAAECSGIRSTIALMITCLAGGYLLLRTGWARTALLLAAIPVLVLKNGIRIATLSLLTIHVSPVFLFGRLHHDGGVVFFAIGMLILLPVLRGLQSMEAKYDRVEEGSQAAVNKNAMPEPSRS